MQHFALQYHGLIRVVFAYVCVFAYRPNKENTGEVNESGASVVKHALNPEKPFMQVHYLKVRLKAQSAESSGVSGIFGLCRFALYLFSQGYFLLKFLADQVGEEKFLDFFKVFVGKFHGQLILSQVSLSCMRAACSFSQNANVAVGRHLRILASVSISPSFHQRVSVKECISSPKGVILNSVWDRDFWHKVALRVQN